MLRGDRSLCSSERTCQSVRGQTADVLGCPGNVEKGRTEVLLSMLGCPGNAEGRPESLFVKANVPICARTDG